MVLPEFQRMLELLRATGADSNFSASVLRRTSADRWQPTVRHHTCAICRSASVNRVCLCCSSHLSIVTSRNNSICLPCPSFKCTLAHDL